MSDGKSHEFRPPLYNDEARATQGQQRRNDSLPRNPQRGSEQKGWDAYRKWLSTVSSNTQSPRAPLDASIYSWKGYQNWADRVRQSWKSDES